MSKMFEWFYFCSSYSAAIPLLAALILWRRLDTALRLLGVMFLIATLIEIGCWYLAYQQRSNLWLFHVWTPVEFTLTILAFSFWQKSLTVRRNLRLAIPAFFAILVVNKIFFEPFSGLDSLSRSISSIVIVGVAAFTFQRMIIEPGDSLLRDSRLWVSSAALIYHAGTLALFTLGRAIMADNMEMFEAIYDIHSVINIFTNLLFAGGFLCRIRR
jgi:hypothetical protein